MSSMDRQLKYMRVIARYRTALSDQQIADVINAINDEDCDPYLLDVHLSKQVRVCIDELEEAA